MKFFLLSMIVFLGVACSTGHCRRDGTKIPDKIEAKPPTGFQQENLGSLFVAKADGSLQCDMKDGVSLGYMANDQLSGIKILSSRKQHDGLVRIQKCGIQTGMMNVYEIRHQDLSKAHRAGFTVIKENY